jgi:PPK2 family polyphosphate:nucleotide phosphotransferase
MYRHKELSEFISKIKIAERKPIHLHEFATEVNFTYINKEKGEDLLEEGIKQLSRSQDILYAHNRYGVLIIFQAMDAAGKDGAVKHVMSGLNPAGVKVHSFKTPTRHELDHDYFWRHYQVLPARGEITIFNRSHYENVLVTRVHPEYILNENLPGIHRMEDITEEFWNQRFKQIRRFEKNLVENGTIIIKFFLHVSKEVQKKRFLERIDDPSKNWKFSAADVEERTYWNAYQQAYAEAISATSTREAPWYIIPADDKWVARLCIAAIINRVIDSLDLQYPVLSVNELKKLKEAKEKLMNEE